MSRIPQITSPTRLSVPGDALRVPSAPSGEGLARGLQAASQATQRLAELSQRQKQAEQQNRLIAFETELTQLEPQIKQEMLQAEPGQQEEVLESRLEPLRDRIEEIEEADLREQMSQRLKRKRARMESDLIRSRTQATVRDANANLSQLQQTLRPQIVSGDVDVREAIDQYREAVDGLAGTVVPEAQQDELVQDAAADFAQVRLDALTDTRGKAPEELQADLTEAGELLDDPEIQGVLSSSARRVYSNRVRQGRQGLDEAITAQGLGEVRQAFNRGFLGEDLDREAVEQGMDRLNELVEDGRIGSDQITDLARSYIEAIEVGDPRTGPQKLATIESMLTDEAGIAITPELRESLDKAKARLADASRAQSEVDRQVTQLQSAFALNQQAPENIGPSAWEGFEDRMIDDLDHDPADVVRYMARHDAPLEGVRSRMSDTFSGELRIGEGVRMQRALSDAQRRNLMDGLDDDARHIGSVAFEMLQDVPLDSEQGKRIAQTIETNRGAILDAGNFVPSSDNEDSYDPSEALLGIEGVPERVPVQLHREIEARFRYLAAEQLTLGVQTMDVDAQRLANHAASQVAQRYVPVFPSAPPMDREMFEAMRPTPTREQVRNEPRHAFDPVEALRRRGATGTFEGFFNQNMPQFHRTWETSAGEVVIPITSPDSASIVEFAVVGDSGRTNFITPEDRREDTFGRGEQMAEGTFDGLMRQMAEAGTTRASDVDPLAYDPTVHGGAPLLEYSQTLTRDMRDAAMRAWIRQGNDVPASDDEEDKAAFRSFFIQYARDVKGWPRVMPREARNEQ